MNNGYVTVANPGVWRFKFWNQLEWEWGYVVIKKIKLIISAYFVYITNMRIWPMMNKHAQIYVVD